MIFGEQNAVFRNNQRIVPEATIVHPLAKGPYLLFEDFNIAVIIQRRWTGKRFADV